MASNEESEMNSTKQENRTKKIKKKKNSTGECKMDGNKQKKGAKKIKKKVNGTEDHKMNSRNQENKAKKVKKKEVNCTGESKMDSTKQENGAKKLKKKKVSITGKRKKKNGAKNLSSTEECKIDSTKQGNEASKVNKKKVKIINNSNCSDILPKSQSKELLKWQQRLVRIKERKRKQEEKKKVMMESMFGVSTLCKSTVRKHLKNATMAGSSCKQRIAVDMSFDDLMEESRLIKCVKQLNDCYSANRRVANPAQFYITNYQGKCHDTMARLSGSEHWDVHFKTENYLDIFDKEDIIYLTSESDNVLTTLDVTKVYIIGGLVDYNVHEGLCHKLAKEKGLKHARLPIDKFIQMKTKKVLAIDKVYKILLDVSQGKPWKDSILEIVSPRKGTVAKESEEESKEQIGIGKKRKDLTEDTHANENVQTGANKKMKKSHSS